jgi:UDPglucose 6-dehydrogenase
MTNKKRIGIVGVGMVGGALHDYLQKRDDVEIFLYDTGKNLGSMEEINEAEIVFVCVPTPYKEEVGGFDISYVEETCAKLEENKIVVIKSTVLPGTTEKLQKEFSQHKFLFNPEFLVEARAEETMERPDRQIMGYTTESKEIADQIMNILPDAPYKKIMKATEAEMVKYFGNAFLSVKVIFANQMYDICDKLNIDYDEVKDATAKDLRIGPSHLNVFYEGYRGYSGKCLPKDVKSLISFAKSLDVEIDLLEKSDEINGRLIK